MANTPLTGAEACRCAVYTRKSTNDGMDRDFNSLERQREVCSAYIRSQRHKGWVEVAERYDDGVRVASDRTWDISAVPDQLVERQLLLEADIPRLSYRHRR